jgi:two-component system response regulator DesR
VIRIMIVEETALLRRALRAVLSTEEDLEVVADLSRLGEALDLARVVRPDVVVTNVEPGADEVLTAVGRLLTAVPGCGVLARSAAPTPDALHAALRAGARGFVGRNMPTAELALQVRAVARGEFVVDPTVAVAALNLPPCPLTGREREVLRVAAAGLPLKEIARMLHLSYGTVRNYLSVIMRKTGTRNRFEAVRRSRQNGWI